MPVSFDVNTALKDKKTKRFIFIIIIAAFIYFGYLILNNKHNKLPLGIETNIPLDTTKKNMRINNGVNIEKQEGDVISNGGTKNVYQGKVDTNKTKR